MRRLRSLLLDNLHLKAIALVLSLGLFVFVRGDRVTEVGVMVPVMYEVPDNRVLVTEPVRQLRVTLAGRQSRLRAIVRRGLDDASVDLRGFTGTNYVFDESLLQMEPGVRLVAIQPASMEVRLEDKARKAVPVSPSLVGTPDPAFRLTEVSVSPAKVAVVGAQSAVRRVAEVKTLPIDVDGRWESTTLKVGLSAQERGLGYGSVAQVAVHLNFEPRYETRSFQRVPVEVINSTWRTSVRPTSVRVTVEAPVRLLPGLSSATIKAVADASELENKPARTRHRLPVELEGLPDTVKTLEIQPPRVLVRLEQRMPAEPGDRAPPVDGGAAAGSPGAAGGGDGGPGPSPPPASRKDGGP